MADTNDTKRESGQPAAPGRKNGARTLLRFRQPASPERLDDVAA